LNACSKCQRLYPLDAGFCPIDGGKLAPVAEVEVPSDPEDPRIGQAICGERYQVRRKVADGGMGRVYQALDLQAAPGAGNVALKVLHEDVAADPIQLERFRREYQLSHELPHEHIVEVFDFQETEDDSYALVMEYLEGEELRMLLKRDDTVPPARLIRMLSQLAIGLREPHQRRFVHRDIKPDNIFLCHTEDGPVIKLLDFGSVRDNTDGAKKLTVIGTTIGSPFYMAPEQAQGAEDLDQRADVWSLAAIAYESLVGTVPFEGKTGPQVLLAILSQQPQPPSIVAEAQPIPPRVDDVIDHALAKDPAERIETVGELADRFGQAYGLTGAHTDWAYLPERQLQSQIEQTLQAAMAQPAQPRSTMQSLPGPDPTGGPAAVNPSAPVGGLGDDNFVMGVPSGPPMGLIVAVVVSIVVALALVIYFVVL